MLKNVIKSEKSLEALKLNKNIKNCFLKKPIFVTSYNQKEKKLLGFFSHYNQTYIGSPSNNWKHPSDGLSF